MYRMLDEDPARRAIRIPNGCSSRSCRNRVPAPRRPSPPRSRRGSPFSYRILYTRDPNKTAQDLVDTQGEVEVGEDGRTIAVLGVCHDVTEQVRAEEARELAQARYRLMTEESGDIIILYSTDAKMLFCSNALERLIGRSADEIRDGGYKRFIHPDDGEEASKMMLRPVNGDIVVATWRIQHAKGHYLWLETTIRTICDAASGEPLNVVSVSRDVTARVQAEEERNKAYDMYRVMTTEASDAILLFGPDRKILFASDALARVMGRSVGEIENGRWMICSSIPTTLEQLRAAWSCRTGSRETLTRDLSPDARRRALRLARGRDARPRYDGR